MKQKSFRLLALTMTLCVTASAWPALAQPRKAPRPAAAPASSTFSSAVPKQTRTYKEVTPQAKRDQARKLFAEANRRFEQRQVDEAVNLYRRAYALWPHPRILYNIATSMGYLNQPLESARLLKKVLEYGPGPIGKDRYRQTMDRYMQLMGQLAVLRVTFLRTT